MENGEVVGVKYEKLVNKVKQTFTEMGQVILATGGYGADFG
jgi:succinate dehydrogenase/fumarate reductase flavoprotein subunit